MTLLLDDDCGGHVGLNDHQKLLVTPPDAAAATSLVSIIAAATAKFKQFKMMRLKSNINIYFHISLKTHNSIYYSHSEFSGVLHATGILS